MQKLTSRELIPFVRENLPLEFYEQALDKIVKEKFDVVEFVFGAWDACDTDKKRTKLMKMIANDMFFGPKLLDARIRGSEYEGKYLALLLGDTK